VLHDPAGRTRIAARVVGAVAEQTGLVTTEVNVAVVDIRQLPRPSDS
jgi:uncharacterized alkaline shock family protein YloU